VLAMIPRPTTLFTDRLNNYGILIVLNVNPTHQAWPKRVERVAELEGTPHIGKSIKDILDLILRDKPVQRLESLRDDPLISAKRDLCRLHQVPATHAQSS
jgi:hypothetical protein